MVRRIGNNRDALSTLRRWCGGALIACLMTLWLGPANAVDIRLVRTPAGHEAWLVEDHSLPVLAVEIAFRGGAVLDPVGKEGLAYMASGLLDEGAGDFESKEFQTRLADRSIQLGFNAYKDSFSASLKTLSAHRGEAFHLLGLALTQPRFDGDAVARIRRQILVGLAQAEKQPNYVAARGWTQQMYPGHPYGRPTRGTAQSIAAITDGDLKAFVNRELTRDNIIIGVVGDIEEDQLADFLDAALGGLSQSTNQPVPRAAQVPPEPALLAITMDVPQSQVRFGHVGIKRNDPDWYAAFVMNYILGGGGLTSRLMEEVREKRGLAYSVGTYFAAFVHGGLFTGRVATQNARVRESIGVIYQELVRLREHGVSAEELAAAKTYLTGSYALRFDTSSRIANQLVGIQLENLGLNYINRRNDFIEAVTQQQIARVARRLLKPDQLRWTIVGSPQGITPETSLDEILAQSDAGAAP